MTSITSPWDFKHLEVVGSRVSRPAELFEIRGRIPELKVETRKRIAVKKEPETEPRRPRSPAKRESLLHFKPKKEKVVAVKVVLPKKKSEITERNYLCSCESYSSGSSNDEEKEAECDIDFSQLMNIFTNYKEKRTNIKNLTNIARGFHERRILSNDEAIKVSWSEVRIYQYYDSVVDCFAAIKSLSVITHETVNVHVWKILLDLRSFTKFISYHVLDLGSLKARDCASLQFRFYNLHCASDYIASSG